jgi:hypothetical protein
MYSPGYLHEVAPGAATDSLQQTMLVEEGYIYIHCHLTPLSEELLIRIWKTTYLFAKEPAARSALLHAENISIAPVWTAIQGKQPYSFLLIFEGLPKTCNAFDLIEQISQPGGFAVSGIPRNEKDVYHVNLG